MATVPSPPLERCFGDLKTKGCPGYPWFCVVDLERFFEVPEHATTYWVEANTRQWPDRSGQRVRVRLDSYGKSEWEGEHGWDNLYPALLRPLHKLGVGAQPKAIYFRLVYEE